MASVNRMYVGVNNIAKKVVKGYAGNMSGKAEQFFEPTGTEIYGFTLGSDNEVLEMLTNHYNGDIDIADYWSVGDVRQASDSKPLFQVSSHTSLRTYASTKPSSTSPSWQTTYSMPKQTTIKWVIIGIKHDTLTTNINGYNKAAITIQTVGMLGNTANDSGNYRVYMSMNDSNDNTNSWKGCQMRKYLTGWASNTTLNSDGSGNFYKACNFKSLIKKVNKSTNTGSGSNSNTSLETTNDYVFLLSEWEIFGVKIYSVGDEDCTQYTYWANHNTSSDRVKKMGWEGASGYADDRALRSPQFLSSTNFCCVLDSGSSGGIRASYSKGVAPACCL